MNETKLITVLGANDYIECNYDEFDECTYIQEALIRKYKDELKKVVVFATEKSVESNWEEGETRGGEYKKGLQKTLIELQEEGLEFEFELRDIPNGYTEDELWEIFDLFIQDIDQNDRIYFDITHGFRYQPMLIMSILNYVKVLKGAEIKGIEYGLFEKLGHPTEVKKMPVEERNVPILDLTALNYLNDWVNAIDSFIATGNAKKIDDVSKAEIKKVLTNTRGKDKFFKSLGQLVKSLKRFDLKVKTCRGKELNDEVQIVLKNLEKIEANVNLKNKRILPFVKLLDKIKDKFNHFERGEGKEIKNYFQALQWCSEHDLVQQGLTILTENIITIVVNDLNQDYKAREVREDVACALTFAHKRFLANRNDNQMPQMEELNLTDENLFKKALDLIEKDYQELIEDETQEEIFKIYDKVADSRNDINHFGFRDGSSGSIQLKNALDEHIEDAKYLTEKFKADTKAKKESTKKLFLLFSHQMTDEQRKDAEQNLAVDEFVSLPDKLQKLWSNIPPEKELVNDILSELQVWLSKNSTPSDYILIQGDFGAAYLMVQWAFANDLIPVYSTTVRKAVEEEVGNEIKINKTFKHELFRTYEKLDK